MISVVIPVYNAAAHLSECIDSLLAQTFPAFEIVLVDDGSSDESGLICEKYASKDSRVKVIHKKNGGVSSARNAGIDAASGEYLVFVDSDDCVDRQLLEYYYRYLEGDCIPVCNIREVTSIELMGEIQEGRTAEQSYSLSHFMEFFCAGHVDSPCNKIYRRDTLRRYHIYFPETMSLGEDMIFNLSYLRHAPKNYHVSSKDLYYYRQDSQESLSSCFRTDLFDLQLYMFQQLRFFLEDMNVWNNENKGLYFQLFWDRLYLTLKIYKKRKRTVHSPEMQEKICAVLCDPVWSEIWSECRKEKVITGKMKIKKMHVALLRLSRRK